MTNLSRIQWLTEWAEPDGDQDTLADVRAEVRWLLKRVADLETKLAAAKSVMWMAEQYADGHAIAETGAEQHELATVLEIINGQ